MSIMQESIKDVSHFKSPNIIIIFGIPSDESHPEIPDFERISELNLLKIGLKNSTTPSGIDNFIGPEHPYWTDAYNQQSLRLASGVGNLSLSWAREHFDPEEPAQELATATFEDESKWSAERLYRIITAIKKTVLNSEPITTDI